MSIVTRKEKRLVGKNVSVCQVESTVNNVVRLSDRGCEKSLRFAKQVCSRFLQSCALRTRSVPAKSAVAI